MMFFSLLQLLPKKNANTLILGDWDLYIYKMIIAAILEKKKKLHQRFQTSDWILHHHQLHCGLAWLG